MSELSKAAESVDFYILKNSDKEIYDAYTSGLKGPKFSPSNDIDYIAQLNKSFFNYYTNLINKLPENEQPAERIKCKLALDQIENALKILSFNKNILDKNLFLFYNIAYVSDIIKRNSNFNNQE